MTTSYFKKRIFLGFGLVCLATWPGCAQTTSSTCIDPSRVNPDGICTMQYDPVCGCDGKTYSNACVASNAGLTSFKPGTCPGSENQ